MASSPLALANVAAKIGTIGQVRAAMGAVTATLHDGYGKLEGIHASGGIIHDFTPLGFLFDRSVDEVYNAAKALLDVVNASAATLYNIYNGDPDLQTQDISTYHAAIAGKIIVEANDALKAVEDAANQNWFDIASIVEQAVAMVATDIGEAVQSVTNAVAAGATAFVWAAWPTLLLIGGGVAIYLYRKPILRAIGGKFK